MSKIHRNDHTPGDTNSRGMCANLLFGKTFSENCIQMKEFESKGVEVRIPGVCLFSGIFDILHQNVRKPGA